jgi:hypothetical protein
VDLRGSDIGMTIIGWAGGESEITFQTACAQKAPLATMFVSGGYFKAIGVVLAVTSLFRARNLFVPLDRQAGRSVLRVRLHLPRPPGTIAHIKARRCRDRAAFLAGASDHEGSARLTRENAP